MLPGLGEEAGNAPSGGGHWGWFGCPLSTQWGQAGEVGEG